MPTILDRTEVRDMGRPVHTRVILALRDSLLTDVGILLGNVSAGARDVSCADPAQKERREIKNPCRPAHRQLVGNSHPCILRSGFAR